MALMRQGRARDPALGVKGRDQGPGGVGLKEVLPAQIGQKARIVGPPPSDRRFSAQAKKAPTLAAK
jgi:hypothetical protein